ncbi:hypothetical protein [Chamaesiphon sp. GL140_3_metabinner_50]|nr:hypothetical protein [Chamaesiphon sp. GL140_3_metabinner_50]
MRLLWGKFAMLTQISTLVGASTIPVTDSFVPIHQLNLSEIFPI